MPGKLSPTVAALEEVDEPLRGLYVEHETGGFQLDLDKYAEHVKKPVAEKNRELLSWKAKQKATLERAERLKDVPDDELEEFLERRGGTDDDDPPPKGDPKKADPAGDKFAAREAKLKTRHETEKKTLTDENAELRKENRFYKLTVPLRQIALDSGVLPEDLDVVLLETQPRFTLNDKDKIVLLDEDGEPSDVTPEKFFKEVYKEKRPKFYAATGATGSGAQDKTTGSPRGAVDYSKLDPVERIRLGRQQKK